MNKSEEFNSKFDEVVWENLKVYNKDQVNWVKLKLTGEYSQYIQVFSTRPEGVTLITVREYADWFSFAQGVSLEDAAIRIAQMCASTYNALVGNAMREFGVGVYITDLFDNVKSTIVINDGPTFADPTAEVRGWAAYRFKFAAGR